MGVATRTFLHLSPRAALLPSPLRGGRQAAYGGRLLNKDAEAKASAMGGGKPQALMLAVPPSPTLPRKRGGSAASKRN